MLKKILRLLLKSIPIITLVAVGVLAGLFAFDRLVVQPENKKRVFLLNILSNSCEPKLLPEGMLPTIKIY